MNLVIVESPAKSKTIEGYLGKDFKVLASFGHVRDLPKKELGVDVKDNYKPTYEISPGSKKTIAELKKYATKAKTIYLATDLDREGEAISWHVREALKVNAKKYKRITFSEITKSALTAAIKKPREINMDLVDAQQARRILDRLVGYKLSPMLWKKVKTGLSAGRVQSVAVRLVVEREREITGFDPEEFWTISVLLSKQKEELKFKAFLKEADGEATKKMDIKNKKQAEEIEKGLLKATYKVLDVEKRDRTSRPSAPFTTSTLQMEASRKLGSSAKQTMRNAQKLYEAGHITYMRTDSINLSTQAITAVRKVIEKDFGKKYLPESVKGYKTKTKKAQEAHEAIRPTHFDRRDPSTDAYENKLYELIWKRTVASQMKEAIFEVIEAKITAKAKKKILFLAKGETIKFDGFIKVYMEGKDDETKEEAITIPELKKDEDLEFHELFNDQKFTEPPKRYSEATLVKKLESLGIGRPSTYAPTMSTIQDRGYVKLEEKRFHPEEIAMIVIDLLVEHFAKVVDYKFTAKMEDDLDEVAAGDAKWQEIIDEFYVPFAKNLKVKTKELDKKDIIKDKKLKEKCPECKSGLVEKLGRYGKFVACSNYPECKYSRPIEDKKEEKNMVVINDDGEAEKLKEAEEEKCEKCGGKMILKEGKFGKFLACENYPKCKNTKTVIQKTGIKCPDCGEGDIIERKTRKGRTFWGCSKYPGCKYASWVDPAKKDSAEGEESEEDEKEDDQEKDTSNDEGKDKKKEKN